jgi:hypothetical protein
MVVWYLDDSDEITDAVARLRDTDQDRVIFVVPPGSRIATGRINFRILAREAGSRDKAMAVASPDEQVRAMATAAGVITAATPDQAEAALDRGDAPPEPQAAETTTAAAPAVVPAAAAARGGRLRWPSRRARLGTVTALATGLVLVVVAWRTLPSAQIMLTPRVTDLGPIDVAVTASSEATAVDVAAGVIPAVIITIPLQVEDAYPAGGTTSTRTRAEGEVIFSAAAQEFDQEIAAGTRVLTPSGIAFETTASVTLPRSEGNVPAEVHAPVAAVEDGEAGNVEAGAISVVPSLADQGISVTNPEPTSGGRFEEQPLVEARDYDAAAVDLRNRLAGALAAYLRDPANTPAGLTVFPETAVLGTVTFQPVADAVVGTNEAEFTLRGSVEAQVEAVDPTLVDQVTAARLRDQVPADMVLVPGSLSLSHDDGSAEGDVVTYQATASGAISPRIDPVELRARLAGLPVSGAQAILEGLGTATVNVWPGFLGDLPDDPARITLDVTDTSGTE